MNTISTSLSAPRRGAPCTARAKQLSSLKQRSGAPALAGRTPQVSLAPSGVGATTPSIDGRFISRRTVRSVAASAASVDTEVEVVYANSFDIPTGQISVKAEKCDGKFIVCISPASDVPLTMHWGVGGWTVPAEEIRPAGTNQVDDKACQTPIPSDGLTWSVSEEAAPASIVFVLKETQGENWYNAGGCDFEVLLKPPTVSDVTAGIVTAESEPGTFGLFQRMCLALESLEKLEKGGPDGMAFFYAWFRLSSNRQLAWYNDNGYNYQGKDMAHVQKTLAQNCARLAVTASDPFSRHMARLTLAGLPRGGGNGDEIRLEILNIMRSNGIKEGHRPGIHCDFLEQWHQKLHSNTTQEDIFICEAYLHFLHTGMWDDFWAHLWDNHGITRERLANMKAGWRSNGIHGPAVHLPHLIGPMNHFLWILKITHSGADMDTSFQMCRGNMDGDMQYQIQDMLDNRHEWWVPGKIVEIRKGLEGYWRNADASRDFQLLDCSLDNYFRTCIERTQKAEMSGDDIIGLTQLVLENALTHIEDEGLQKALTLWQRVSGEGEKWNQEWALKADVALQFSELALEAFMDRLCESTQEHANVLGEAASIDSAYIMNFGEEAVRGHGLFILSELLQILRPMVLRTLDRGLWQVCSAGSATGMLKAVELADVQGQTFDEPTIIMTEGLGGLEDIPQGVVGVLTPSPTDVLSHIAIRARNQGVLLATCLDPAAMDAVRAAAGTHVTASPSGNDVMVSAADVDAVMSSTDATSTSGAPQLKLAKTGSSPEWAITASQYSPALVGGKSLSVAALAATTVPSATAPACITVPFGSLEKALKAEPAIANLLEGAEKEAAAQAAADGLPAAALEAARAAVRSLSAPAGLEDKVMAACKGAGFAEGAEWEGVWDAIKQVWASKWTERAWLARRSAGIPERDLDMAVLLMPVMAADYAFVLHSAHPLTGDAGRVYGEVVKGLGEVLVGNAPGSALTFDAPKAGGPADILSLPSKREMLRAADGSVIARSDSNGEDLEAYAGAGLYDSVAFPSPASAVPDYCDEPLVWDQGARGALVGRLTALAAEVEAACGGAPQDIEGCIVGDQIYVVQTRPQVL